LPPNGHAHEFAVDFCSCGAHLPFDQAAMLVVHKSAAQVLGKVIGTHCYHPHTTQKFNDRALHARYVRARNEKEQG
jgi:hypothetical protein